MICLWLCGTIMQSVLIISRASGDQPAFFSVGIAATPDVKRTFPAGKVIFSHPDWQGGVFVWVVFGERRRHLITLCDCRPYSSQVSDGASRDMGLLEVSVPPGNPEVRGALFGETDLSTVAELIEA